MIRQAIAHIEDSLLAAAPNGGDAHSLGALHVGLERVAGMDDLVRFKAQPGRGLFENG